MQNNCLWCFSNLQETEAKDAGYRLIGCSKSEKCKHTCNNYEQEKEGKGYYAKQPRISESESEAEAEAEKSATHYGRGGYTRALEDDVVILNL